MLVEVEGEAPKMIVRWGFARFAVRDDVDDILTTVT